MSLKIFDFVQKHFLSSHIVKPKNKILLISSLRKGSGNTATANRLSHNLRAYFDIDCIDANMPNNECESFCQLISKYSAIIALHAYRAGHLLTKLYDNASLILPPLIIIFGGTDLHSPEEKWQEIIDNIVQKANKLVCFNNEWKNIIESKWKNNLKCKVTVIPQAVEILNDYSYISPFEGVLEDSGNKKFILWCGEIRKVKDPLFALRLFSMLSDNKFHLLIVGYKTDSVLENEFENEIEKQSTRITYLSGLSQISVQILMRTKCWAFINTSVNEGMCLAMLECMRLNVPVIVRRNTGNCSVIKHGKNGLIYETEQEAVDQILLLENDRIRENLIVTALNYVTRTHSISGETKAYKELLNNLIKEKT
ncbi:unnamed protein product [Didymodactylos carnosus]|uniref:Glycosyl transferase family 1 domain-containing protein n=3 Tax=Didymodactylos carnosus TaxID=1234261 RepID=A0A8S2F8P4_9BILA|nr:unnamed protein product [Didymodactylos carnosus]CAF4183750.1 unnamed protein product [Didymodactylos carnosus]